MRRENVDFPEALRILAERAGVTLTAQTPRDAEEGERIKRIRELNEAAARYWHNLLINSPAAKGVREYLAQRAISEQSIVNFQLGYAPDSWDALGKYLVSRGYQDKDIFEAGLSVQRDADKGGGHFDRFRNRLVFPIRDMKGRTIGFGARALSDQDNPKYLNSPQTALFYKSTILYAIDMAKDAIRAQGAAVIVEGYVDALMAHQVGYKNVVASMGTALTETQLKTLQRLSKKFILALDADAAGLEAMRRGLSVAQDALDKESVPTPLGPNLIAFEDRLQAEIRVAVLPAGHDPDDLLREDPSAWQSMLDGALPVVDYLIQNVTSQLDLTSARGKSEAKNTLMPLIWKMSDGVARTHYVQELSRRLRMDERELLETGRPAKATSELQSQRQPKQREVGAPQPAQLVFGPEEYCLAMLLRHPEAFAAVERLGLQISDFLNTENAQLFAALNAWSEEYGGDSVPPMPAEAVVELLWTRYEALIELGGRYEPATSEEIEKSGLRLRERGLRRQIEQLRFLEEEARRAGLIDEMQEHRQRIALLTEQLNWTQEAAAARSTGRLTARRTPRDRAAANEKTV
jgi:DNA primase